jgi:hypothetical protein
MNAKKIFFIISSILSLAYITSCKKDEVSQTQLPYLFRPAGFSAEINKASATLKWNPVDSAISYVIQISQDSLQFQNIVSSDTLTICSFTKELAGSTQYSARVQAIARNPEKSSKFNQTLTFKTDAENLFGGYTSYMADQGVLSIAWLPASNVTKLLFRTNGKQDTEMTISDAEKLAGQKTCTGLTNATYTVLLYNGIFLRGSVQVTVEGDVWVIKGNDLAAALNGITKDSAVVVIKPGTYSIGGSVYNITKNIKIRGLSKDTLPIICMTGASSTAKMLEINTTSRINFVRFENIEFSGYLDGGTSGTKIGYLFNQSNSLNIGDLSFKNCIMRNIGNSPIRLQTTALKTIDNLIVDNCRIFDIGYSSVYAVVNLNAVGSSYINNISFTNSTIYNFAGSLILHNSSNSNSVLIQNCTFNEITTSGTGSTIRYFIDYTASYSVSNGVTIQNCIFGSTPRPYTEGVRANNTQKQIIGSYCTSDFKDNNAATGSASIMASLSAYSGLSTDLFVAPLSGNFNFKDLTFVGKPSAGDPRWRK